MDVTFSGRLSRISVKKAGHGTYYRLGLHWSRLYKEKWRHYNFPAIVFGDSNPVLNELLKQADEDGRLRPEPRIMLTGRLEYWQFETARGPDRWWFVSVRNFLVALDGGEKYATMESDKGGRDDAGG